MLHAHEVWAESEGPSISADCEYRTPANFIPVSTMPLCVVWAGRAPRFRVNLCDFKARFFFFRIFIVFSEWFRVFFFGYLDNFLSDSSR